MKLTPLEIRKHEFARSFRGYDPEEVESFLNVVAQHFQSMTQDLDRLQERLEEQTMRVNHYLKVEEALEHALEGAKTVTQEKLAAAEAEARNRLEEAQAEAEKTLREAERRSALAVEDAESRANLTLSSAETRAASARQLARKEATELLRKAKEESTTILERAEKHLVQLTSAARDAIMAANGELEALEAERQRVLGGLGEFLQAGLNSKRNFESAEPPPELARFDEIAAIRPPDSLEGVRKSILSVELTGLAEEEAPESAAAAQAMPEQPPPKAPESAPAPPLEAEPAKEERDAPAPERGLAADVLPRSAPDEQDASHPVRDSAADDTRKDQEAEVEAKAPDPEDDDSGEPFTDDFMDELPSADDSFEEEKESDIRLISSSDDSRPKETPRIETDRESGKEFGAEEEIQKIRRILEDLDK